MTRLLRTLALGLGMSFGCQIEAEVGSNFIQVLDAQDRFDGLLPAQCSDREDNDGDGQTDYPFDPGCADANDGDETSPSELPACFNEADDDGDSLSDFPLEPGCESAADDDETDPATIPECSDGIDNDNNAETDYPEDIGCYAAGDPVESSVTNSSAR